MSVPAYLKGRGRGRGRGNVTSPGGASSNNSFAVGDNSPVNTFYNRGKEHMKGLYNGNESFGRGRPSFGGNDSFGPRKNGIETNKVSSEEKFKQVSSQHQQAIQQFLDDQQNQHPDQESSDEDEEDIGSNVLSSVFKSYSSSVGDQELDVQGALDDLVHSFRSGASACLVCIDNIKKNDAIWNCQGCYAMFHMQCIQKWVKEGVYQHIYKSQDNNVNKDIPWHCPKCRLEYKPYDCPTKYMCFCGKEQDPKFDPWLVPHSCGQTCNRKLKPECGHSCLLLCHPGPCPPCPKTVRVTCHCGKQAPVTRRCSAKSWSCGQICGRPLTCGQHACQKPCHPGQCPPCPKTSIQPCMCRKASATRPCASPGWQCDEPCGRLLSCNSHRCERNCHSGNCGPCPRSGPRKCPCGKSDYNLPCTEDIPTCGDTCGKQLDCGIHTCTQRCHTGPCGTCRQMAKKKCRCGQKQKEVPCYKEYLCDTKCTKNKDCMRHQCKRKCCDGNCPSCEQICGRTLGCKNHKCASRCHKGSCYPCPLTVEITCYCKAARITVPCGRDKVTKPPRCNLPCRIPPKCHHPSQIPHRCHFGVCPPCRQMCAKTFQGCPHICPVMCHTAVRVKIKDNVQRAGPWEGKPVIRDEIVEKPCPPCLVPIPVQCFGEHEIMDIPCFRVQRYSCARECGRLLSCTNHTCTKECHEVTGSTDKMKGGDNCEECEAGCEKPRPEGCTHDCSMVKCHPGECPPCEQRIRMRCHCQLSVQYVECDKWCKASQSLRDSLKSCGGECPKVMPCEHVCGMICHGGDCPNIGLCEKKVTLRCKCRRRKKELICKDVSNRHSKLDCDDICQREKDKKKQLETEQERAKREEEELKNLAEVEEFERKMKGKKRKPRKQQDVEVKQSFIQKYKKRILFPLVFAVLAIFAYYLMQL